MRLIHAVLGASLGLVSCGGQPPQASPLLPLPAPAVLTEAEIGGVVKEREPVPAGPATGEAVAPKEVVEPQGPVVYGCPCGCGKMGCQCGKPAKVAAVEAPPKFDPAVHSVLFLGADWCVNCKALYGEVPEGVGYLDIDADAAEVAKYWNPSFARFSQSPGRPAALPAFVALSDGRPVRFWLSAPRAAGQVDWELLLNYGRVDEPAAAGASPYVKPLAGNQAGSGVIVGRSGQTYYYLTNSHVIRSDGGPSAYGPVIRNQRVQLGGTVYPAAYVADDSRIAYDLALLRFQSSAELPVVDLADTAPAPGSQATSHGYPYTGRFTERPMTLASVFPDGMRAVGFVASAKFLSGESGSAVTDADGNLVGLVYGNRGNLGRGADWGMVKAFLDAHLPPEVTR